MRVLIADDDALSRRILKDSLEYWGYDVVVCKNGNEAWKILEQDGSPTLAILDWIMPGMDGVSICQKVRQRKNTCYTYIILLTAKNSREDIITGLEAGADDYVVKPFHHEELKYRLQIGQRIIELEQNILQMANTDYLTGLLNRRAFMERMEGEVNRVIREKLALGIIILDIDYFKRINDIYGHQAGDLVLQEISACLVRSCRRYDFVGRYGGEEFIVCLPGADFEKTFIIAERMRSSIEKHQIFLEQNNEYVNVTASFGIVGIPPGILKTADELIRQADDALYQAKGKGRNRVVKYDASNNNLNFTVDLKSK